MTSTVNTAGTPLDLLDDSVSSDFFLQVAVDDGAPVPGERGFGTLAPGPSEVNQSTAATIALGSGLPSPLLFKAGCRWPVSGQIQITREAIVYPQFGVDFGDGTCDADALLLLPGEDPIPFTLTDL
jgi:hypothetical protein